MASFAHIVDMEPVPGGLGLVTQSGAFGAMIYARGDALAGVGCSSFASVGNEADTEFADFVGLPARRPGDRCDRRISRRSQGRRQAPPGRGKSARGSGSRSSC